MTDQPEAKQSDAANSATNVSGGVNASAERIDIGADVVGRDKVIGTYIEHYHAGGEAASSKPKVYHNLPQPDYGQFIGREQELRRVHELLSPASRHFVVTVDGIGGIGKSALALEVASHYLRDFDHIPSEERFEAIIWTSAKQNLLTVDGIVQRRQALRTLDDIYTAIAVTLQREDITRARPVEQSEVVRNALIQQRTLLVVDNLETIDDEMVFEFLRDLPAPTKAIVTTRHRIDVAYPLRLTGMPWDDAQVLIAQECIKKKVDLSANDVERLYDRTGGVPLAMVWSIAQMGMGYSVERVLHRLGQPTSDIARFCFQEAVSHLHDEPAYHLLMALSIFVSETSREMLGIAAELTELDRDDSLVLLERFSLVNHRAGHFVLLPLTKVFVSGIADETFLNCCRQRALQWINDRLKVFVESQWSKSALQEIERENYLSLIDWAFTAGYEADALLALRRLHWYLWSAGYWADLFHYLPIGIHVAERNGDMAYLTRFHRHLGNLYRFQGDIAKALYHLEVAVQSANETTDIALQVEVLRSIGMAHLANDDINSARNFLLRGLAVLEQDSESASVTRLGLKSHTLNNLSEVCFKEDRLDEALKILKDSQIAAEQSNNGPSLVVINRLRGRIAFRRNQLDDAERHFALSLELSRSLGLYQDEGYAEKWLARTALSRDDHELAMSHAMKSQEIFSSLQMADQLRDLTMIFASLESGQMSQDA
jgi:tetratricopeptide (TPR) repeat protein